MEIPFDGILTLLVFLVGIPALVLQLISAAERRAAMNKNGLDVTLFLVRALFIIIPGLVVQFLMAYWLEDQITISDTKKNLIEQLIWLLIFIPLSFLAFRSFRRIPEQYGRREKIVEKATHDVIREVETKGRVAGGTFVDLVNLGKQCDSGQEREMVVKAFREIVKTVLDNSKYDGDSFEALIEDLVHMLASSPSSADLSNYDMAVEMLSAILSTCQLVEKDDDAQRALHAISKLGQTLIIHFKSVERNHILLKCIDALELALAKKSMLTEVSQVLFEIGVSAVAENQDFVVVAALDKMTTLAEYNLPLSKEFTADLFGLLAHYWSKEGSRHEFARSKMREAEKFFPPGKQVRSLLTARDHLRVTMYFDEADRLNKLIEDLIQKNEKNNTRRKIRSKKTKN